MPGISILQVAIVLFEIAGDKFAEQKIVFATCRATPQGGVRNPPVLNYIKGLGVLPLPFQLNVCVAGLLVDSVVNIGG